MDDIYNQPMPFQTHLALIFATLRTTIFGALGRLSTHAQILAALHNHIARAATRLDRLFTLWQAGKLPQPRAKRPNTPRKPPQTPRIRFSRAKAWLVRLHQPATAQGSQLYNLLLQPEAEQFLREVPQAARILRPLLRLVWDTYPPVIAPKPRPKRARKPAPAARSARGATEKTPRGKYPRFNPLTYSPGKMPPLSFKRR